MVADVAMLETKASVSVLKVTMENIVSWKLTGVNHLLVLMVLHVLMMVTWCSVSVQSGLSGDTVKKVGGKFFLWWFPLISRVTNDNAKARGTDWRRLPVVKLLLCHWSSSFKICAPCHYCRHVFISESVWYDRRGVPKILWDVWNIVSNPPLCRLWAKHSHPTRDFNHTIFNPIRLPKFNTLPPPPPPTSYRTFQNNLTPAIPSPQFSCPLGHNKITPTLTIYNWTAHVENQIKL